MCGFTGIVDFNNQSTVEDLTRMADSIIHRGPDDSGNEFFMDGGVSVGFGFRRLAIIDLSPKGHQPMRTPDERLILMLNGEIYNYKEVRALLIDRGYKFVSESDTEVVLHAYSCWGIKMLQHFIGMFSIAIYDREKAEIFLIRDRAGVKPLFWYFANDLLLFGSELKVFHRHTGFKKELDINSVGMFLNNGTIPAPFSIFKNVQKVRPGFWLKIDLRTKSISTECYWSAVDCYNQPASQLNYTEAKSATKDVLQSACNYRMVADVPVGVFLSGGYDSTAVAALIRDSGVNLNTYTIGFEEAAYNEANHAKAVANHIGSIHTEYICKIDDAKGIIPELPDIYDEPFGDPSAIPTTLVSRIARKYVTVALSADAGDELFAGYSRHVKAHKYLNRWVSVPDSVKSVLKWPASICSGLTTSSIGRANKFDRLHEMLSAIDISDAFNSINETYSNNEIRNLLKGKAGRHVPFLISGAKFEPAVSVLNRVLAIEYSTYLVDDILQKVDRATMSCSLEGREPLLDHRILELVATFPDEFKLKEGNGKVILKDIVHDFVPREIMERPKMGFGVPIDKWLKSDLRELFEEVLDPEKIASGDVLDVDAVIQLKESYLNGSIQDIYRIWYVFVFQQWYNKWMA